MLFQNDCFRELSVLIFLTILTTAINFAVPAWGSSQNSKYAEPKDPHLVLPKPRLSSPEECARVCRKGESPKICYYQFTVELYTTVGGACQVCTPNSTNAKSCQCVLADGFERTFLAINRALPGPTIRCCEGDKVVIDVKNSLEGMDLTIHWHGIFQEGTQYYDGVPMVTQCPIHQGNTFRYQWYANPGTHFYHTHTGLQKADGIIGSIIVGQVQSEDLNGDQYDHDLPQHVVFINDWYHELAAEEYPGRLHTKQGQAPVNILINGKGIFTGSACGGYVATVPLESFTIYSGQRYRFRLVNSFASVCPALLTIEGHCLTVIATDGEPIQPVVADSITSFSGERYDFVINADQPVGAYWIQLKGLGDCGKGRIQQLAILRYTSAPFTPQSPAPTYDNALPPGKILNAFDVVCDFDKPRPDAICINQLKNAKKVDKALLKATPDFKIFLPFRFFRFDLEQLFKPRTYNHFLVPGGQIHAVSLVDNLSYIGPPAPPISQINDIPPRVFCNSNSRPANCSNPCFCTHLIDIPLHAVCEVILVDEAQGSNLSHPFHLHGYAFNVIGRGRSPDKNVSKISAAHCMDLDKRGLLERRMDAPPGKDTIAVPNNGYVVFRFKADNPGYWLLHCHFLFHLIIGMGAIFHVGKQNDLPPVPRNFPRCGDYIPPIDFLPYNDDVFAD